MGVPVTVLVCIPGPKCILLSGNKVFGQIRHPWMTRVKAMIVFDMRLEVTTHQRQTPRHLLWTGATKMAKNINQIKIEKLIKAFSILYVKIMEWHYFGCSKQMSNIFS